MKNNKAAVPEKLEDPENLKEEDPEKIEEPEKRENPENPENKYNLIEYMKLYFKFYSIPCFLSLPLISFISFTSKAIKPL